MTERIVWMSNNKDTFIHYKYSDIEIHKISPEGKPKLQPVYNRELNLELNERIPIGSLYQLTMPQNHLVREPGSPIKVNQNCCRADSLVKSSQATNLKEIVSAYVQKELKEIY